MSTQVTRLLPHWADKHLDGEVELYAQLNTRDGRLTGNGIVVEILEEAYNGITLTFYGVLTDFGNRILLTDSQLERQFYPPEFRMKDKLADFRAASMEIYLDV